VKNKNQQHLLEKFTPTFMKRIIKKIFWKLAVIYYKIYFLEKGKFVEFGYRFRYMREDPHHSKVGERTIVEDFNVWNARNGNITIGERCFFGLNNILMGPIEIGDGVSTGPNVSVLGPRHPVLNADEMRRDKTIIGNNVWLGTGAIILFGVKIGDNAMISAGAVVTKDVENNAFVAGNPARDLTKLAKKSWQKQGEVT
jgi:acetyltransferase-like isoleucine patch superfamily enzyme